MNELEPLLQSSESPRTRELLRAGRGDAPAHGFSERLLVGLGVSVAAGTVSVVASAGAAGAALQGAVTTSTGTTGLGLLVAKWVAVGVVGGGILAGGAEVAFAPHGTGPSPSAAVVRARSPVQQPRALAAAPSAGPEHELEPAPAVEPNERAASAPPVAVASASPGGLGREVEAIDGARRALAAGELERALNELNGFERIERTGVLAREAQVLRIETLYRMGQDTRARQLSEQYSKQYPNDTHAARLRALERGKE